MEKLLYGEETQEMCLGVFVNERVNRERLQKDLKLKI